MSTAAPEQKACCCCQQADAPPLETTEPQPTATRQTIQTLPSVLLSVLVAFFPKCPLCWAAYMSMFGSFGLANIPYMGWLFPVLLVFLGLHLLLLLKKVPQKGYGPFVLSLVGVACILTERIGFTGTVALLYMGMAFIFIGSLWNSFSFPTQWRMHRRGETTDALTT